MVLVMGSEMAGNLSLNLFLSIDVSNRMIIGKYEKEKAVVPPHEGLQLFNSSRIINPRIS